MGFDVGDFSEATLELLWEFKQCGASAIPDHKKCHKKVIDVKHVAEHVGKGVVAWKTGKVLGTAISSALESQYGIPREASQKIAETIIQAATMTALEANHLKTVDQWAKKLVVEAAAAFLGKTAHGAAEHAMSAAEAKKIIEQAAPILAGKVTGIGTAVIGGKLPPPGEMVKAIIDRSARDTKMLMDMFARRAPSFAEMDGAGEVLADLAMVALISAYRGKTGSV